MKPHGPIPPYFNTRGDRLCLGGIAIDALIAKAGGTPLCRRAPHPPVQRSDGQHL